MTTPDGPAVSTEALALNEPKAAGRKPDETAAPRTAGPLDDEVRKLVLSYETGSGTVDLLIKNASDSNKGLNAFASAGLVLVRMGIVLASGGASMGMGQDAYATVVDGRALRKRIPELKKIDIELEGLGIY